MLPAPDHAHSRPPLARMLLIHQALPSRKYPTASSLATELQVSSKSIHRDLEFMRDRLELPLQWDGAAVPLQREFQPIPHEFQIAMDGFRADLQLGGEAACGR